ncbi:ATP-binding protein [Solidesulfovibrio magneticus]|nr:hybrid sensor histidine kinase/response regulator [Solidesulfovibrio magneticus]
MLGMMPSKRLHCLRMKQKMVDKITDISSDSRRDIFGNHSDAGENLIERCPDLDLEETGFVVSDGGMRFLLKNSSDIIFVVDPDFERIVQASRAACEFLGFSHGHIIGKTLSVLHPVEEHAVCREVFRACVTAAEAGAPGHSPSMTLVRRDGLRASCRMAVTMLGWGVRRLACCIYSSPALRGIVGSGLQESEAYFAQALPHIDDGAWSWNPVTDEIFLSRQWLRLLGYEPGDIPTTSEDCNALLHPDDRDRVLGLLAACVRGERTSFSMEYRLLAKDGSYRWLHGRGAPVRDTAGRLTLLTGATTDITRRKETELALAQARDAAMAASRAKSAFLASMSHEIRTPMNVILGMAELLAETSISSSQRRYLEGIAGSGRMLSQLLSDILDFSQIEADRVALFPEVFDPAALAREVCGLAGEAAAGKGLDLQVHTDPSLPDRLVADPLRVRQVLLNLVWNAVKYTQSGRITVSATPLSDPAGQGFVLFSVRDSGPGIAPEAMARIFDPFSQADAAAHRRQGGAGLGLSISRALARLMGGDVVAESAPGAGSCFSFTLPALRAGRQCVPERPVALGLSNPARRETTMGHGATITKRRVLLAEDSESNRELIALFLENEPVELVWARNGYEAVAAVTEAREPFDAVLMDVEMPVMDGLEATRHIRRLEADRGSCRTPVALLTAHALYEFESRGREAGCDAFLTKPIRKARLLEYLGGLFGWRLAE